MVILDMIKLTATVKKNALKIDDNFGSLNLMIEDSFNDLTYCVGKQHIHVMDNSTK